MAPSAEAVRIGLICEGTTDRVIIDRILQERFEGRVTLELVHPHDATGGLGGGWTAVVQWCGKNDAKRRSRYLVPLFDGQRPRFDLLLFHLDTDIHLPLAKKVGLLSIGGEQPIDLVHRALDQMLWCGAPNSERPKADLHLLFCAVQATETWIVAGALPTLSDPETRDPKPLLLTIKYGVKRKSQDRWDKLFEYHLKGNVRTVAQRCPTLAANLERVSQRL